MGVIQVCARARPNAPTRRDLDPCLRRRARVRWAAAAECCPVPADASCDLPLRADVDVLWPLRACVLPCPFVPGWDDNDVAALHDGYQSSGVVAALLALYGAFLWLRHPRVKAHAVAPFIVFAYVCHMLNAGASLLAGAATVCDVEVAECNTEPPDFGAAKLLVQFASQAFGWRCVTQGSLMLVGGLGFAGAAMGQAIVTARLSLAGHTQEQIKADMRMDWFMLLFPPIATWAVVLAYGKFSARTAPHLFCEPEGHWMDDAFNVPFMGIGAIVPSLVVAAAFAKTYFVDRKPRAPYKHTREMLMACFILLNALRCAYVVSMWHHDQDYGKPAIQAAATEHFACKNRAGAGGAELVASELDCTSFEVPFGLRQYVDIWIAPIHLAATLVLWWAAGDRIFKPKDHPEESAAGDELAVPILPKLVP